MRKTIPLITIILALAAAALTGCAAATPTGASSATPGAAAAGPGTTGSAATHSNECSIAHDALAKVVTGPISAPYQKAGVCTFGIGPNSSKSGAALGQLYGDVVNVNFATSDVDSAYQGAKDSYSPTKPLTGLGTEAQYYDGGNGDPQIFARTSNAFCDVQTFLGDASEVGLTKPSGSRTIAAADVPKLAAEFGAVCTALFGS